MLKRFMNRTHRDQKGITGLETAIILIAFVVVAAVFAFTALSAGLFSSEKSKEAVYSGLEEAQSTVELKGNVTTNSVQALDTMDSSAGWTSSSVNTTKSSEGTIKKEGTNSLKVVVGALSQNDYVYAAISARSFTTLDNFSFWVYTTDATDAGLAAGDVTFALDDDSDLSDATATFDLPVIPANTWTYVSDTLIAGQVGATDYGFVYTQNDIRNIYIDMIQAPVPVANRTDMPVTYVDSLDFTVVNALAGGEAIDFALPTDTNNDGVLNASDATKTNYLTIAYDDAYQQVNDLAWNVTRIVGDNDYLLEQNEIFKVTVDLKAVNLGAIGDEKLGTNHAFTLEVKPAHGAVLQISRTTPQVLYAVDDLN